MAGASLDDNSQLGRTGCAADRKAQPIAPVIGLPKSVAIDSRWCHTCSIDEAGKVWCWGIAQAGALGRGDILGNNKCSALVSSGIRPGAI